MPRKKKCCVCGKWFQPDPRVGARQKACGAASCQRERHRRADRAWHAANPDYDRDRRRADRVDQAGLGTAKAGATAGAGTGARVPGRAAQDEMPPKVLLQLEELIQVRLRRLQDEMLAQVQGIAQQLRRHLGVSPQDATDGRGPGP